MTYPEIIHEIANSRAQRVLTWLYSQEPTETETFRLARVLDVAVMPPNVQGFLTMLIADRDDEHLFTPDQCHDLVQRAFSLTAQYLATPNGFLTEFIDAEHGPSLVEKLAALMDYPYYGEFLFEWLRGEGLRATTDERLRFLHRTEYLALSYADAERIAAYLAPFEDFFHEEISDGDKFSTIVASMMADKGIDIALLAGENLTTTAELAGFIKAHLAPAMHAMPKIETNVVPETASVLIPDEEGYKAFLEDLRHAGVHLPMPSHMRHSEEVSGTKAPPVVLFVGKKLRDKTITDLFRGNKFEYDRMLAMIDNAKGYEDALLNFETIIHLQKAEHASKLLVKWANVIRLKFSENPAHAVR